MNKRIIALFCSLVAVVVIIVVMAITFTVGEVSVETTANIELNSKEKSDIIYDSKIVEHSSVFSLDEKIAISNIELCNPQLKVLSIERIFPNKVRINITKRVPILSLQLKDGTFALVDRELKVVQIVDTIEEAYISPIIGINLDTIQSGAFITTIDWLKSIIQSAEELSFVNERFSTFITSVEYQAFASEEKPNLIILKTNTGVSFAINENQGKDAFNYFYTHYMTLKENQKNSGYIVINENQITWVASLI